MMTLLRYATALLMAMALALPAMAMSLDEAKGRLDEAKSQGLVGEMPTGYLGVVSPGGDAAEIVEAINDARRAEYARIAEKHGIAVSEVEAVAGKKAIEKTPSGEYIQVDGRWVRK
ncbi:YdbL family protein [Marinobacter sp. OP 3.4]|uniref:YdbL family protein n=1 Tax=Marinobacter sp. OP 3.4 TaxID=3076501 RepID=UPI002E2468FC